MDTKINIQAPINQLGYGVVGTNIAEKLSKITDIFLSPIGKMENKNLSSFSDLYLYNHKKPSLKIWHQFDLFNHIGCPRIGFPIFELDRFTPTEKYSLLSQDALIVTSRWAEQIIKSEINHPNTHVVNLACDPNIFSPKINNKNNSSTTTFINVGKWEIRKGHDFICEAFNKAFSTKDDVKLIMHCFNPCFKTYEEVQEYNQSWEKMYKNSPMGSKIEISRGRLSSQFELAELMKSADCGIFPARAEGWNLDLFEMIYMGIPCITTSFSAHTEYANYSNALLIDIDKTETAYDGIWFNGQGNWAELGKNQLEQCIKYMREIHLTKQKDGAIFKPSKLEGFSWEKSAKEILDICQK